MLQKPLSLVPKPLWGCRAGAVWGSTSLLQPLLEDSRETQASGTSPTTHFPFTSCNFQLWAGGIRPEMNFSRRIVALQNFIGVVIGT